jgi:hypothetical protein
MMLMKYCYANIYVLKGNMQYIVLKLFLFNV